MPEDLGEKFFRYLAYTLIAAIFVGGLCFAYPTFVRTRELKREDAKLAERIEAKRREIAKLTDFQRRFRTDPDFVEKIARENKRVYPGELVFVFEKE